jgi:MFS family permease
LQPTTWNEVSRKHAYKRKDCTSLSVMREEKNDDTRFGFPVAVASPLALLLVSQFVLFIGVGAVIPSIPLYGKEIGLSSSLSGVVISAPAVALLVGSKFGGTFADVARKPAMILGMAIIALSDIGTAFATGLTTLVIARLGLGAGRCISESGERGMLADLAGQAPELRGRALAAQQAAVALGIAIGAPLGGLVIETYGPRAAFLCVSAAAICALVIYLFLPETVGSANQKEEHDKMAAAEAALLAPVEAVDGNRGARGEWMDLLSQNQWRRLALCQCGASFGFAAKIASIPILAANTLPGGAAGAGALLSAAGLSGLVGAPIGGWLTDRMGAKSTAILSGIVSAIGLILVPFALSLEDSHVAAAFCAAVIGWSLGASAQGPALTALAQEMAPLGAEATSMALPRAAGDGTYIIAPFLLGLVTDAASPGTECAVAGVAMLLGVLALAVLSGDENM